jgi:hypothetical protein
VSEIARAREALAAEVRQAGDAGLVFLEARIREMAEGFEIRHREDVAASEESLVLHTGPHQARHIAQTTASGQHRPLKTSPNLRRGWRLAGLGEGELWTALDYLYPSCALDRFREAEGRLATTSWRDTAERQSGIYSAVRLLESEDLPRTVEACCAASVCGRRVAWGESAGDEPLSAEGDGLAGSVTVPCPEPCSLFISFARKVLILERAPRHRVPGVGVLAGAETEQLTAAVERAAAGTLDEIGEGDFGEPANRRRLRYLAARLRDGDPGDGVVTAPAGEGAVVEPCDGCPRPEPCEGCPLV